MGYYCLQCGSHVQIYSKKASDEIKKRNKKICPRCYFKNLYLDIQRLLTEGRERIYIRDYIITHYHWGKRSTSAIIYHQQKKLEKEKGEKNGN